jgi:hypothetical protein
MPEADLAPVVSARLPIGDRCCWKTPTEQTDGMGTVFAGKKKSHLKACGPESWSKTLIRAGISQSDPITLLGGASTRGAVTRFAHLRPVSLAQARQEACGSETCQPLCRGFDGGRACMRHHVSSGRSAANSLVGAVWPFSSPVGQLG